MTSLCTYLLGNQQQYCRLKHLHNQVMLAFALIFTTLAVLPLDSQAESFPETAAETRVQQRELFLSTYQATQSHTDLSETNNHWRGLKSYPLYPWLEYEQLMQDPAVSDQKLLMFAQRYPGLRLSTDVYEHLAEKWREKQQWQALLTHLPATPEKISLQCYRLEAALALRQNQASQKAHDHWQNAEKPLPGDCSGMEQRLIDGKHLSKQQKWEKIGGWIEEKHYSAAKRLAKQLDPEQEKLVNLWIQVHKNPARHVPKALKTRLKQQDNQNKLREIIVSGVMRAADKKLQTALPLWDKARKHFNFTPAESGRVESNLGMWEAWRHWSSGMERLAAIPGEHRSNDGNVWLARIALRNSQWQHVLDAISFMQAEEAERDIWRYWQARALENTGKAVTAKELYQELAKNASFYGFLSADHLGISYQRLEQDDPDRTQRMESLLKTAAIQRWQEWSALGENKKARREWFNALNEMDKEGILASAELALRAGDANLAIWSVSRTRDWNVIDLRFPLLYEDYAMQFAKDQGINPAWVMGVMRRESAFDANARSHANALGLMQLLPATARQVGRKVGVSLAGGRSDILKPEKNVRLGSAYLSQMLKRFDGSYVKATAAYNAGPGRIPGWTPDKPIQADQWIESIPFRETRRYVRAVMAYMTIYNHKLAELQQQQSRRLSSYLQPVGPQ